MPDEAAKEAKGVMMYKNSQLALLFIAMLMACALGCEDGESSDTDADGGTDSGAGDADSDTDADTDTDTDADGGVDTVSSATPGVESAKLTEAHAGWQKPDCLSCHQDPHMKAGYAVSDCTLCHGTNGAPVRPMQHEDTKCLTCHAGSHASLNLTEDNDCRSCHVYAEPATAGDCAFTSSHDAVVIGAGGGGLSAAAILAQAGLDVVVLEQHYKVGGYMVSFTRGDYRFEASLHAMDGLDPAPYPREADTTWGMNVPTFEALGIADKVTPVVADNMYRVWYPKEEHQIAIPADVDEYRALLKEKFPAEADGIDDLFDTMADIDQVMRVILRYQYAGKDVEGDDMVEFIEEITDKGLLDQLLLVQSYMETTTLSDFLADFITDPELIAIWTQLSGFAGAEPDKVAALFFLVMWNNYHFGGYYYFEGGSQAVSDALAEVIVENGGMVRTHSRAVEIDIEGGLATRVHTADGACFEGDHVISNANAPYTLLEMVGEENLPTDPTSPFYPENIDLMSDSSMTVGLPALQVCLGVNHDYTPLFDDTHEIMLSKGYDQTENFSYYTTSDIDNVAYAIANYGMLDPGVAPAGKNVICLTSILMYDWENEWHTGEGHDAYDEFKYEVGMKLVERAEEDFLPELSQYIEVMEVGTAHTLAGYTSNPKGTIFGWDNTPEQSMKNRLPNQTHIDNLYLSGAWAFPGGGQSTVLTSGFFTANTILAK